MFTGIVEELGHVTAVVSGSSEGKITIKAQTVLEGTKIGDSIAVNGVCLTVVQLGSDWFVADVMPETLRRSNLGALQNGSLVNLERAMAVSSRFGGHIVSGHIDATGVITNFRKDNNAVWVTVKAPEEILRLVVEKGSIAIDGISLTVAQVSSVDFKVSIIPHTGSETTLLKRKPGDMVNLETDIIGKYVQKLMNFSNKSNNQNSSKITLEFLAEHGF